MRKGKPLIKTLAELHARCTPDGTGCLMYRKTAHKYGIVKSVHGKHTTHRAAFLLAGKTVPEGWEVCHTCDKPGCCNIDHLFAGTHEENMKDRVRKGRHLGQKPLLTA